MWTRLHYRYLANQRMKRMPLTDRTVCPVYTTQLLQQAIAHTARACGRINRAAWWSSWSLLTMKIVDKAKRQRRTARNQYHRLSTSTKVLFPIFYCVFTYRDVTFCPVQSYSNLLCALKSHLRISVIRNQPLIPGNVHARVHSTFIHTVRLH